MEFENLKIKSMTDTQIVWISIYGAGVITGFVVLVWYQKLEHIIWKGKMNRSDWFWALRYSFLSWIMALPGIMLVSERREQIKNSENKKP